LDFNHGCHGNGLASSSSCIGKLGNWLFEHQPFYPNWNHTFWRVNQPSFLLKAKNTVAVSHSFVEETCGMLVVTLAPPLPKMDGGMCTRTVEFLHILNTRGLLWRLNLENSPHDGMDGAMIGIGTGRKRRYCKCLVGRDRARIKSTRAFFQTPIMANTVMSGRGIRPNNRLAWSDSGNVWRIIRRPTLNLDVERGWLGKSNDRHAQEASQNTANKDPI